MLILITGPAIGKSYYGNTADSFGGVEGLNEVMSSRQESELKAYASRCAEYQRAHNTAECGPRHESDDEIDDLDDGA